MIVSAFLKRAWRKACRSRYAEWLWSNHLLRVYVLEREHRPAKPREPAFHVNDFDDLRSFQETERWHERGEFLAGSEQRIEAGETVYTLVEDGLLVHYAWLIPRQKRNVFTDVSQPYEFAAESSVIYGVYTHPRARGRGFFSRSIQRMIDDAFDSHGAMHIYTGVAPGNLPSRRVIEKAGFQCVEILFKRTRFGRTNKGSLPAGSEPTRRNGS